MEGQNGRTITLSPNRDDSDRFEASDNESQNMSLLPCVFLSLWRPLMSFAGSEVVPEQVTVVFGPTRDTFSLLSLGQTAMVAKVGAGGAKEWLVFDPWGSHLTRAPIRWLRQSPHL